MNSETYLTSLDTAERAADVAARSSVFGITAGPDVAVTGTPGWYRRLVTAAVTAYTEGRASTCPHHPTIAQPQPVLAASWRRGYAACHRCKVQLGLGVRRDTPQSCDGCTARGHDINPVGTRHGLILFFVLACPTCRVKIGGRV